MFLFLGATSMLYRSVSMRYNLVFIIVLLLTTSNDFDRRLGKSKRLLMIRVLSLDMFLLTVASCPRMMCMSIYAFFFPFIYMILTCLELNGNIYV